MGGIMAVKQRRDPLGGIHLLDEASGTYNIPYLRKYFPQGGVVLVGMRCSASQGLIVSNGNRKGSQGFTDLVGLEYVNRQKGSGTRILCDYLAKQNSLDTGAIHGYEREEFTHTAVGCRSSIRHRRCGYGHPPLAKIYGLDFIPLWDEQ
jgi:putative molybdopterin biosynthesis protein